MRILSFASCLATAVGTWLLPLAAAVADQAAYVTEEQAQAAAQLIRASDSLRTFCPTCPGGLVSKSAVDSVRVAPTGYRDTRQVLVNGRSVDLAYAYVRAQGEWINVARRVGAPVVGVVETLPPPVDPDGLREDLKRLHVEIEPDAGWPGVPEIRGRFVRKPLDKYGFRYTLVPEDLGSWPLLRDTPVDLFFDFASQPPPSFTVREVAQFEEILGFRDYYDTIRDEDIYSLQARKEEISARLAAAHREYRSEYERYCSTSFLIDLDRALDLQEARYDTDRETLQIFVTFAVRAVPRAPNLSNYSDPQEGILNRFAAQGFRSPLEVPLPLDLARVFFASFDGPAGRRVGQASIRYAVRPNSTPIEGVRLAVTGMRLEMVEFTFLGAQPFRLTMTNWSEEAAPYVTFSLVES